ncbi:hypothetical protein JCM17843_25080 [Kordiimonadales bacterium JCM 17843]|nr:hypothetical protein JCM17843_25080 [Kordiimonadales bacterium JCM 17843]
MLRIIIGQQLSVKAAATIAARVDAAMDGEATPERFLGLEDDILRGAGLSAARCAMGADWLKPLPKGSLIPMNYIFWRMHRPWKR